MDINERIFEILNQQGMKQADLARAIGASSGLVADWKNNNKTPKMNYICQIADYLNVSVDYLLGRTDNPVPASKLYTNEKTATPEGSGLEAEFTRLFGSLPPEQQKMALAMLQALKDSQ